MRNLRLILISESLISFLTKYFQQIKTLIKCVTCIIKYMYQIHFISFADVKMFSFGCTVLFVFGCLFMFCC